MGLVTGVIGCLQALEAIKIILNYKIKGDYSNETSNLPIMSGTMLLFDAISCRFRNVKLRPRREEANQVRVVLSEVPPSFTNYDLSTKFY